MIQTRSLRDGDPMPEPAGVALDPEVLDGARAIVERVRVEGDAALVDLTKRFDGADISGRIRVPFEEMEAAADALSAELREALDDMAERLVELHEKQLPAQWSTESWGVRYGEAVKAIDSVGCYVPGGRASYPSTVLMTAVPARVAGVRRVVLCTPPSEDGSVAAPVLYAALISGVNEVFRVGGAHAIGALAHGTETVTKVDKIVGPGNAWVTAAKKDVYGIVGIDSLAGPTELVIVADASADPSVLAVDLVAQAEHDPMARTTLVALDEDLPATVIAALDREVAASPRREIVEAAMEFTAIFVAANEEEAAAISDRIAPEHLQIVTGFPQGFLAKTRRYGAAFLGPLTPVSFGDYGVGSNHVLPTMANARFSSGLRAADFVTVSSWIEVQEGANDIVGPGVEEIATAEGLAAHAKASRIRRNTD